MFSPSERFLSSFTLICLWLAGCNLQPSTPNFSEKDKVSESTLQTESYSGGDAELYEGDQGLGYEVSCRTQEIGGEWKRVVVGWNARESRSHSILKVFLGYLKYDGSRAVIVKEVIPFEVEKHEESGARSYIADAFQLRLALPSGSATGGFVPGKMEATVDGFREIESLQCRIGEL